MTEEKKYSYDRFGSKGSRVGQAVVDLLAKDQPEYQAEEILEEMGKGIVKYICDAADEGCKSLGKKFFLLHLLHKKMGEFGVTNVLAQSARCFHTEFSIKEVMEAHPNATKTFYEVDQANGEINLLWTVPSWEDCKSVMRSPTIYDSNLVKWAQEALQSFSNYSSVG